MKILDTTDVKLTSKILEINKGFGSLTFVCEPSLDEMDSEKINIEIQRANGESVEITNVAIPLREYLMLGTIGDDAIGSDIARACAVLATVELVAAPMAAIHLYEKDILRITLTGLKETKIYLMFGHEAPLTTDDLYSCVRKSMNSEHESMDFDVPGYDACVFTDFASISEINLKFDNGQVIKTTPEELRQLAVAADPIAQVHLDKTVSSSFANYLQLPLKGIVNINVKKSQGDVVSFLFRRDNDITLKQ